MPTKITMSITFDDGETSGAMSTTSEISEMIEVMDGTDSRSLGMFAVQMASAIGGFFDCFFRVSIPHGIPGDASDAMIRAAEHCSEAPDVVLAIASILNVRLPSREVLGDCVALTIDAERLAEHLGDDAEVAAMNAKYYGATIINVPESWELLQAAG